MMAFTREQAIAWVRELADFERSVAQQANEGSVTHGIARRAAGRYNAIAAMLEAEGEATKHVQALRACLEVMAHPTEGWPLTEIADRYNASLEDVAPAGRDAIIDSAAACHEQMRREWAGSEGAMADVLAERLRQNAKWGEQNQDPFTYITVLGEEVGELCQAALHARFGGPAADTLRMEAVQTAAVALAIVECLDRGKWTWRSDVDNNGNPLRVAAQPDTLDFVLRGLDAIDAEMRDGNEQAAGEAFAELRCAIRKARGEA